LSRWLLQHQPVDELPEVYGDQWDRSIVFTGMELRWCPRSIIN
jgi:hypothetical protein